MYVLTEKRLVVAAPILEKYRAQLVKTGSFESESLERECREALRLGRREFKDVVRDLLKNHARYRIVAAYYMQNGNAPGVISEFKGPLAELYRVKSYDAPERQQRQHEFWDRALRRKSK